METRICTGPCGRTLPLTAFTIKRKHQRLDGRISEFPRTQCRSCRNAEMRRRYHADPDCREAVLDRVARYQRRLRRRQAA